MRHEPRQYDIWRLADGALVLILQDEIVGHLTSRVMAPLIPVVEAGRTTRGLNPVFDVGEEPHLLKIELLSAVPLAELRTMISNAGARRDEIVRALDILFTGV